MIRLMKVRSADLDDKDMLERLKQEANRGRLVVMMEENDEGLQNLVNWVCRMMAMCKAMLHPGRSMLNVRLYVNALVDAAGGDFARRLASERKRDKYLCMVLGALMARVVFMGTAGEMAKVFKLERLAELSVKKYITLGQQDVHMKNIFSVADENVSRCHT